MRKSKPISRRQAVLGIVVGIGSLISLLYFVKWFRLRTMKVDDVFFETHLALLSAITEVIIPETDVPGARSSGVPEFVLRKIKWVLTEEERNTIYMGFDNLEKVSHLRYAKEFSVCTFREQTELFKLLEWRELRNGSFLFKVKRKLFGNSFFYLMKQLTVEGYCLSKNGATLAMAYDPIPGEYQACIPLQKNQKAWATK